MSVLVGTQFRLNTTTTSAQRQVSIAALEDGTFVAVWQHDNWFPAGSEIRGQIFNADGSKIGTEFVVNSTASTASTPKSIPAVTALADGRFVVAWSDNTNIEGQSTDIMARVFGPVGPVGNEFRVNTVIDNTQHAASIAALSNGGFVVSYTSEVADDSTDIMSQAYDVNLNRIGGEILANATTAGDQRGSTVSAWGDGYVVFYNDYSNSPDDPVHFTLRARILSADGSEVKSEFLVSTGPGRKGDASAATLTDGRHVVTWTTDEGDGSGLATKAQVFAANGDRIGTEFVVNAVTDQNEMLSAVTALPDGGFAITYLHITEPSGSDRGQTDIYVAIFNADGTRRSGNDLLVGSINIAYHEKPDITVLENGHLLVAWENPLTVEGDEGGGVYAQIVDVGNTAPQFANLHGDTIHTTSGATVLLDMGSNVVLTDDDPFYLAIHRNNTSADDHFGIRTDGTLITLSDGLNLGSVVSLNGTAIADITAEASAWHLEFHFRDGVTAAQVQALIKALTYTAGAVDAAIANDIQIYLEDQAGQGAWATVTVNVDPAVINAAPTVDLDPAKAVTEAVDNGALVNPFGGLTFADTENNTLTVTISFDATEGLLVTPPGLQEPGFEERDGKKFYTFTGTAAALAITMDVLRFDAAERPLDEAGSQHVTAITVGVTDQDNATPDEAVVQVRTTIANRAPTGISLDTNTVREASAPGTEIGTLSATDQANATFTYELTDTAGGRFRLEGNKLVVNNGLLIDYEQAETHTIKVKVSDGTHTFEQYLVVNVSDWVGERVVGSAGNDRLYGNMGNDVINGDAGNDIVKGGVGNDVLYGGTGDDTIHGGTGRDTLYGNAGKDVFVFDTALNGRTNVDTIKNFYSKDDTIRLENAIFRSLKKTGVLSKDFFVLGAVAKDTNDFVGYDSRTGNLWYDSNGNKTGGQVVFANIGAKKAVSYADFIVV